MGHLEMEPKRVTQTDFLIDNSLRYPIYLDHNATTPLDSEVIAEISKSLEHLWGNPSSAYALGEAAKSAIQQSRQDVASMINAKPTDIVFTSGGTEGNTMALLSLIKTARSKYPIKPHVITSNVEHDSVMKVLRAQENLSEIELTIACVDTNGELQEDKISSLIKNNTCLISIMHANNETGIIMPIEDIAAQLKKVNDSRKDKKDVPQVLFHCDAAQSIGKIPVDVACLGVDMLTIVGHKFCGPRIGALYCRNLKNEENAVPLHPVFHGGGQESGYRSGTENTPMIVGLGKAAQLVTKNLDTYMKTMKRTAQLLQTLIQEEIPGSLINFESVEKRLPNTVSVRLPEGYKAEEVLNNFKEKLFASLGASCHSGVETLSQILLFSGLMPPEASRTIRLSVGRSTTDEDIRAAVDILKEACASLKC